MASSSMQEWLNRNAYRRFPIVEDSDMSCKDGSRLPDCVLLDARFCLFGLEDAAVCLKSAVVSGSVVKLVFTIGTDDFEMSSLGFSACTSGDFSARVYTDAEHAKDGEYVLNRPAEILRSRILSVPFGIGADTLSCGGAEASGEVRVADGHNTTLDISNNNLVLGLRRGDGLGVVCPDLEDPYLCDGSVLYFLNGQKADSDGNIEISGGDGITVSAGSYRGIPAVIVCTSAPVNRFAYK